MRHLISINDLTQAKLLQLLAQAQGFIEHDHIRDQALLTGVTVANLFFEPSTRTHASFDLAAQKLNAHVLNLNVNNSSASKGETLTDTVLNLQAMGTDIFVVRHRDNVMQEVAQVLKPKVRLINAGEGCGEHPTQALLDLLTIQQYKPDFKSLSVAIVGDLLHSRVAHSTIAGLKLLGCRDIRLIAPSNLLPSDTHGATTYDDLTKGIKDADVVMMLRIQRERMQSGTIADDQEYIKRFQLNAKLLKLAKPDAIVMHPGPMNRGVEITDDVADGKQSVILQQVHNGVAVRMAILADREL